MPDYSSNDSIFSDIFGRTAWGHRAALLGDEALNYGQLLAKCEQLAAFLRGMGVVPGTPLGICLSHGSDYVSTLLTINHLESISVLLQPRAKPAEKDYVIHDSGAIFLITEASDPYLPTGQEQAKVHIWENLRLVGPFESSLAGLYEKGDCFVIYTSGSTSKPKGVVLTTQGVSANVRAVADYLALSPQDRTVVFTPPAYTFAMSQVLTHLWTGGAILPYSHGLMYPFQIIKGIVEHSLTGLYANPSSYLTLNGVELPNKDALSHVRYVGVAGQHLLSPLATEIARRFPNARIVNAYGCTENSPRAAFYWLPTEIPNFDGVWPIGQAVEGTRIKLVDENGADLLPGSDATGQILLSGRSIMRCYFNKPEVTQERLVNGWYRTGDLGTLNADGNLTLVGRVDNIMNVGHNKTSPEEIETVIIDVLGVLDVGVAPISDNLLGQVPVAFIVADSQADNLIKRIQTECVGKLSAYKLPKKFIIVEAIPKTPYGKIDRRELRRLADNIVS